MTEKTPTKAELAERVEELERQLVELEQRAAAAEASRDEYLDDLRRVAADFDNFKKRAAREQESLAARASERLVSALLPVLDDLERALEVACAEPAPAGPGAAPAPAGAQLEEGVRLVERRLRETLAAEGLREIDADGRFDPHVHEALLTQPSSETEEGSIVQVLQRGYTLGDRVVRPARVVVSAGGGQAGG